MTGTPKVQRSPEEIARRLFELARLELEVAEQIEGLGPQAARLLAFPPPDQSFFLSIIERAEAAWKEAGEPHLPDRDFVMTRLQDDSPSV